MACGFQDQRVLFKTGDKRTLESSDVITVNAAWKPKLKHVKLGLMGARFRPERIVFLCCVSKVRGFYSKARDKEAEDVSKKVLEERKINIDATIVRVMKSRKELDHKTLVNEVILILASRFAPKPAIIKKQIEVRVFLCLFDIEGIFL